MRIGLHTIRAKMTAAYSAALAGILVIFAIGTFVFTRNQLYEQLSSDLRSDFSAIAQTLEKDPNKLNEIEEHGAASLFRVDEGSQIRYQTDAWRRLSINSLVASSDSDQVVQLGYGDHYRIISKPVRIGDESGRAFVARSEEPVRHAIRSLTLTIGLGFPVALLFAVLGGYFLAGRMLAPVGVMAQKAHGITAENLVDRLPIQNPQDEIGRLATAFNTLLGRFEDSFDRLRRFTADASHELRTPLTTLRSVGEVALRDNRNAVAYRETIESMLEETDRLTHLVDSLLVLARADQKGGKVIREPVDLAILAKEVAEFLHVLVEERSQDLKIEIDSSVVVHTDRALLRQAIVNLLDNAIKYTPQGGQIRISTYHSESGEATIEVSDTGPGIPVEERDRIFERFYRIDKARSHEHGGVGLGLSIARWSVEMNGGRIQLESSRESGSTFRIVLPAET